MDQSSGSDFLFNRRRGEWVQLERKQRLIWQGLRVFRPRSLALDVQDVD
jgi:hypothetical protein